MPGLQVEVELGPHGVRDIAYAAVPVGKVPDLIADDSQRVVSHLWVSRVHLLSHLDQVPIAGAGQSGSITLYQPPRYHIAGRKFVRNRIVVRQPTHCLLQPGCNLFLDLVFGVLQLRVLLALFRTGQYQRGLNCLLVSLGENGESFTCPSLIGASFCLQSNTTQPKLGYDCLPLALLTEPQLVPA